MNHERINLLIDRYFEGETTLAEERAIRAYFREGDVHPDLRAYAPLFAYWEQESVVKAPVRTKRRRLPRLLLAIAAALLLLLVARFAQRQHQPDLSSFPVAERQPVDWSRYEVTDEKEAIKLLKDVFKTTSDQMKKGPAITIRELRQMEEILD